MTGGCHTWSDVFIIIVAARQIVTVHDTWWFDVVACEPVSEFKSLIAEEVSCLCVLKYTHTVAPPPPRAAGKRSSATAAANASHLAERRWDRSVASACPPGLQYRSYSTAIKNSQWWRLQSLKDGKMICQMTSDDVISSLWHTLPRTPPLETALRANQVPRSLNGFTLYLHPFDSHYQFWLFLLCAKVSLSCCIMLCEPPS